MADRIDIKLTGVDDVLKMLNALPAEVVSKRGGVVKQALRKGALVILAAERVALRSAIAANGEDESTGLLEKSLIVSRGKAPTDGRGERFLVRVKRVAYDGQKIRRGGKVGKRVTTLKSAQLMEYGSGHQAAQPWIRPAFKANAAKAISVVEQETLRGIDRAAKKYLKQRRV